MTISLLSIVVKHERRIRLVFSNTLAGGAFGLSPSLYILASLDAVGVAPVVVAALVVPGAGNNVELALGSDLIEGGHYQLAAPGVPAIDASTTQAPSTESFRFGESKVRQNAEPAVSDLDRLLYGTDLIWTGVDYLETATGDLAVESGTAVVHGALRRRAMSDGLPWDPRFGAHPRQYVDSSAGNMPTLRGTLLEQMIADDRVAEVKVVLTSDDSRPEAAFFIITPKLKGDQPIKPISVSVPST